MTEAIDALAQYRSDITHCIPAELTHVDRDPQTLVVENLRLVLPIARRYAYASGMSVLDLVQEGNIGLMRAARNYDPTRSQFSTHATWWIKHFIRQAIYRQATALSMPEEVAMVVQRLRKASREHPDMQAEDLADAMHVPVERIGELVALATDIASLDSATRLDDETTLGDSLIANPDEYEPECVVLAASTSASLDHLLAVLLQKERAVIELRYGWGGKKPLTQEETARVLHITREGVRTTEERAMMKLQRHARITRFSEHIA